MDTALVWFKNDLRTHDNKVLSQAIASGKRVVGVYFFDPQQFEVGDYGFAKTGKYRAQFLIESVQNLKEQLAELHISLVTYSERPFNKLPELVALYQISEIHFQKEWTRDERLVIEEVKDALPTMQFHSYYDQFLFHPDDIPYEEFADLPKVFTSFRKKCEKESKVRSLIDAPSPLAPENVLDTDTPLPSLADLGLKTFEKDSRSAFPWKGGEEEALQRVQHYFWSTEKLSHYKKTRNGLVGTDYSSKLSAWLANGSISARYVYQEVKRYEKKIKKNQDTYWLIFELIWRDFFKYVSLKHGDAIFHLGGILDKDYDWRKDEQVRKNWIQGTTEYDFVNANMNELAATGWMSNRGRQNVASFWAKEKEQDWRIGAAYFESMLIDYDVHSNWGNWMYNAGVGNDPRDRKFNIKSQAERYDGSGKFQRLWLQKTLF